MLLCFLLALLPTYTESAWGIEIENTEGWKKDIKDGFDYICGLPGVTLNNLEYDPNRHEYIKKNVKNGQSNPEKNIYCVRHNTNDLKGSAANLIMEAVITSPYKYGLSDICKFLNEKRSNYACTDCYDYRYSWWNPTRRLCCGFYEQKYKS